MKAEPIKNAAGEFDITAIENAFLKHPNEQRLTFDKSGKEFHRRWFEYRNMTTWSTYLLPRFVGKPVSMIQIGVFEGMDFCWCGQHIMTDPESKALLIDPWQPTTKLTAEFMNAAHERAKKNLRAFTRKIKIIVGKSGDILPGISRSGVWMRDRQIIPGQWDLVVIDGDHNADAVLVDAEYSLKLLKPGGLMVFDDVRNRLKKKDHVEDGINKFLELYSERVKLVWRHRYCDAYEKIA